MFPFRERLCTSQKYLQQPKSLSLSLQSIVIFILYGCLHLSLSHLLSTISSSSLHLLHLSIHHEWFRVCGSYLGDGCLFKYALSLAFLYLFTYPYPTNIICASICDLFKILIQETFK